MSIVEFCFDRYTYFICIYVNYWLEWKGFYVFGEKNGLACKQYLLHILCRLKMKTWVTSRVHNNDWLHRSVHKSWRCLCIVASLWEVYFRKLRVCVDINLWKCTSSLWFWKEYVCLSYLELCRTCIMCHVCILTLCKNLIANVISMKYECFKNGTSRFIVQSRTKGLENWDNVP